MRKYIYAFLVSLICSQAYAQEVMQLIGLECDNNSLAEGSYSVMYDHTDDPKFEGAYIPYRTIAVVRNGDEVKLLKQNYLIVPTARGFRYVTQSVGEEPNDTTQVEPDFEYEKLYEYRGSYTVPRLFSDKEEVVRFIKSQKPAFKDAISIHYEKISFITPHFYISEGFDSEVHGGATWFNATEISKLNKLTSAFTPASNQLTDYLSRKQLNCIIIDIVKERGDETNGEVIDENYLLPWAGTIGQHENVFFTLFYENNRVKFLPLVLLNGNSARSFLEYGKPFVNNELLGKLKIKEYGAKTKETLGFISPDLSTRISIENDMLRVYDNITNKLLSEKQLPPYHKIIMSEWALGRFVKLWENEFK